jgi:hypothetical protein
LKCLLACLGFAGFGNDNAALLWSMNKSQTREAWILLVIGWALVLTATYHGGAAALAMAVLGGILLYGGAYMRGRFKYDDHIPPTPDEIAAAMARAEAWAKEQSPPPGPRSGSH